MKRLIILMLTLVFFTSCDETESPVFNGEQTLVYFNSNSATLDVVIDDTGSVDVPLNTTTLQDEDIQVTVELVNDDTTANEENFDFESQVTIPAGEFTGFLTVNGIDQSVDTNPELIVFRISDASGFTFSDTILEVSIKQVCPVPDGAFTGDYLFEQQTPIHAANGVLSFENQVVNISVGDTPTKRVFTAAWLEGLGIGQPPMSISFDLSCNNVVVDSGLDTQLTCGDGSITIGPASTTGTYDPNDDSSFTLILAEYVEDGGCGVSPPLTTEFLLTKQ